jgi:4-hydroxy-tetrahydrodipicolinate synthase
MNVPQLPHGIHPYLVSPVSADGRVQEDVLERLVDDLVRAGVQGLSPLGSTGEVMYLSPPQRYAVVAATLRAAGGRVPVIAGVAAFSTQDAVNQARELEKQGAAGLVVMRQNGFATSEAGVVSYFSEVARAVSIPIVLYTNPVLLGTDFSTEALMKLSEEPNIRYIKDATGDTGRILTLLTRLQGKLEVFSASAHIPAVVFLLGGVGWMAGPACVIAPHAAELYRRVKSQDITGALALQRGLWGVNEAFRKYPLGACIKTALHLRGYDVGDPLAPQQPLPAAAREEIAAALRAADHALETS